MAQNTAATGTKGGGKAAPPTATGRAASAAGPAPEVPGSTALVVRPNLEELGRTALAVSPTDPSFLRVLRMLIDRPELTSNLYDDQEWAYKSSIPV